MKRKISLLIVALSLLLAFAVSASAAAPHELTISEDLQQVELDGEVYVQAKTANLQGYYNLIEAAVNLTEAQAAVYEKVMLYHMPEVPSVLRVELYQTDGIVLQISYIREDLYEPYMKLLEQEEYTVRFRYPANNNAITEKSLLCGEAAVLYKDDLSKAREFEVYADGPQWLMIYKGWLLVLGEEYYYVDMEENSLSSDAWLSSLPRVDAYRVTDPDLCARFDAAMEQYYGDGLGILEDPEVSDRISGIFMMILFCFLPFAVLVAFTIFAIMTKKSAYRTLYIIVGSCALLVLLTVIAIVIVA